MGAIYRATANFPSGEKFGLTAQIRRAAVSLPSNIAEGFERQRSREYVRFLDIAQGSRGDLETQLRIAAALGYLPQAESSMLLIELRGLAKQPQALRTAITRTI